MKIAQENVLERYRNIEHVPLKNCGVNTTEIFLTSKIISLKKISSMPCPKKGSVTSQQKSRFLDPFFLSNTCNSWMNCEQFEKKYTLGKGVAAP